MAGAVLGFFIVGALSVIVGARQIYPPAAWIVFGLFCLFLAAWPIFRRT